MITLKPYRFSTREVERLPRRNTVTIGVGFQCCDGIVLCSDTQMTKYDVKFQDSKLRVVTPDAEDEPTEPWAVLSSFAGSSAIHQRVWTDFSRRLLVRGHVPTLAS